MTEAPVWFRPHRHLCGEAKARDEMDDGEFWAHIYPDTGAEDRDPDDAEVDEMELNVRLAEPCPECGQWGACSYDAEGRALIHVVDDREREDA